jgi:hypothetical protein
MTTPSGTISFQSIENEFGGSHPITMSEYYGKAVGIPTSGTISMSQFQNKTAFSAFSNTFTTAGSGSVTIPYGASTVTLEIVGAGGQGGSSANHPEIDYYAGGVGGGGGGYISWTLSVAGHGGESMSYIVGDPTGAHTKSSSVTWGSLTPTAFGGDYGGSAFGSYGAEGAGDGGAGGGTGGNGLYEPITRINGYPGTGGTSGNSSGAEGNGGFALGGEGGAGSGGAGGANLGGYGYVRFYWA